MINSKPNGVGNYKQGNFIPVNKNKVFKLNEKGGLYWRSSWELTTMQYLDKCPDVVFWGAECIEIPYQLKKVDKYGMVKLSNHRYYPDFYYKLKMEDGSIIEILLEVKPREQTKPPKWKETKRMTEKQIKNYEDSINEWERNMSKWDAAIKFCENKDMKFKLLVDEEVKRMIKDYINKFA